MNAFRYLLATALTLSACTVQPPVPDRMDGSAPSSHAYTVLTHDGRWPGLIVTNAGDTVIVTDVYWNSPAARAGIQKGDLIERRDLEKALRTPAAEKTFPLRLRRLTGDTVLMKEDRTPASPAEIEAFYRSLSLAPGTSKTLTVSKKIATIDAAILPTDVPRRARIIRQEPENSGRRRGWLGVGLEDIADLITVTGDKSHKGIRVSMVLTNAPADKAGIKVGDVVTAINGKTFESSEASPRLKLIDVLSSLTAGDTIQLSVSRPTTSVQAAINGVAAELAAEDIPASIDKLKPGDTLKATLAGGYRSIIILTVLGSRDASGITRAVTKEEIDALHPDLKSHVPELEQLARSILKQTGVEDQYQDLIKRYVDDEQWDDGFKLKEFSYLHVNPFMIPVINEQFADSIRKSTSAWDSLNSRRLVEILARKLDEDLGKTVSGSNRLKTGISIADHAAQIRDLLEDAGRNRDRALEGLPVEDVQFLFAHLLDTTQRFATKDGVKVTPEQLEAGRQIDERVFDLLRYVNYRELYEAAWKVAALLSPDYLDGLKRDILQSGEKLDKPVVYRMETPFGPISVAGTGRNYHTENAAVLIDLGGDDFYADRCAAAMTPNRPFSIVIDFSGNDRYSSYADGAQGFGILGVGMLVDLAGDDLYVAQECGQGNGISGVGILYDRSGNDTYKGQELVQGAGFFGIGILIDDTGKDAYQANMLAQGFGGPKSTGLLVDNSGNDSYYATGRYRTSYDDNPGTFSGLSQGCGFGIRSSSNSKMSRAGGIGILIDGQGEDVYEAGTFSQGGGYFFAWGMLCDYGNGNDRYLGTRYSQGFAAHSAIGYFLDEGGDDHHSSLAAVHSGLSWDLTCTVFIDKAGNDTYEGGGFSLGASAHNGFSLFLDLAGNDTYGTAVGEAGNNTYHGGSSFSLFIDQGGGEDSYAYARANNTIEVKREYSIFMDLKGSYQDLLRDETLPKRVINRIQ